RAVNDVRHALDKYGGHMGTMGAVTHLFSTHGLVLVDASKTSEDALMALALDAGAEDVRQDGDSFEILCAPAGLDAVTRGLEAAGIAFESAEVARLPMTTVPLEGGKAQAILRLLEHLEDVDDVQKVYANFDISEAEMAKLE